jgi:hypothetical protein
VLKPGAYLLAFGGSRTWHRLAAGLEDAGFEIRDSIAWMYAQGFPKSLNVTDAMADYLERGPVTVDPTERGSYSRPGIFVITGFLRDARDAAGWSNRRIDDLFGTNGMSGHWTSLGQQPAVPSIEQWARLRDELGFDDTAEAEGFQGVTIGELAAMLASVERPEDWGTREQQEAFLAGLGTDRDAPPARGWGTALKPAFEPIVVARKPLVGTYGANIRAYGVGGFNIEAARIGTTGGTATPAGAKGDNSNRVFGKGMGGTPNDPDFEAGRWPTNLVLSHAVECGTEDEPGPCVPGCPVKQLDDEAPSAGASGRASGPTRAGRSGGLTTGVYSGTDEAAPFYGDSGGASRMFPVFRFHAKAKSRERPWYLDAKGDIVMHPTVKPLSLIRWLIRLVLRPGGLMLEPFAGSGTAVEAAILEGDSCIAIELGAEHLPLIAGRLDRQPTVVADRMTRGEHVAPEGKLW